MAFIPVPDVAEVAMEWRYDSGPRAVNVFHVREAVPGGWNIASLTGLCNAIISWDGTNASAHRSNEVHLLQVRARDLSSQNANVVAINTDVIGALASPALPSNNTIAISLRTGLAGRSFRGRLYFVGLAESQVAGNFLNSTVAQDILNDYNDLRTILTSNYAGLVVVSRYTNNAPRVTGIATDVTNLLFTDLRVDTQRRRLT